MAKGDDSDAPTVDDPHGDPDDWASLPDLRTHDGKAFGIGGLELETVALILHRGDLPQQFLGSTAVSTESNGQAVMSAILGGNEAAGYDATAALGFAPDNGRLVLDIEGEVRELQSFALDRHEAWGHTLEAGQQQFLLRMVDTDQHTWLMHVAAPDQQVGKLHGFMRALAQQAEMDVVQPTLWRDHSADAPDLLAIKSELISRVDVLPHPGGDGWAVVIEHDDDAG
ncbi:MAG: hypothetical protein AAF556_05690, partial [Pseudomonadota bacterium]